MKNLLLITLLSILGGKAIAQGIFPPLNEPSILVLKYSHAFNEANSFIESVSVIKKNGTRNAENCYSFYDNANNGTALNTMFYTIDRNTYVYRELALFDGVAIDINQLRDILSVKKARERRQYLSSFQHIFLIDLDSPNRLNPNEFKVILVAPYFIDEQLGNLD